MSTVEPICYLLNTEKIKLSKGERALLEAEILRSLYKELINIFKMRYRTYFHVMRFNKKMEDIMIDENFMRFIINDIVSTQEYTLQGIAHYTETPEDVIYEIATGANKNPSLRLSQKIIDLHRSIRTGLYNKIIGQILRDHLKADASAN